MAGLLEEITLAGRSAPCRVMFGPHVTNLGDRRAFSDRHVAYYRRRAAGGAGVIVTETASVHPSDWPYERAPLAADCPAGWRRIARACAPHGTVLLAGLGHAGLQGSSAYSQAALWGPSGFADPVSREVPMIMAQREIDDLVASFAAAAASAVQAGLAGVEIDAGATALLRQFHSGLTNDRDDAYGEDRLRLTGEVLAAVRAAIGDDHVLALRLSCDELAPWAGVTGAQAARQAAALADRIDLLTVVRGGPYSAAAYRPDGHTEPMFNLTLAAGVRVAVGGAVPVALQGSVVDCARAAAALDQGAADLVEMTRAQIADARLVARLRAGLPAEIRPCLLCNQACLVGDVRNPIVSCVADPRSGHETEDAPADPQAGPLPDVHRPHREALVIGGGPAGLEAARVLAGGGLRVRLMERDRLGGALRGAATGPGRERLAALTDWLAAECGRLGVRIELGVQATESDIDAALAAGSPVILATGSKPAPSNYPSAGSTGGTQVIDALAALTGGPRRLPTGPVVVHDPIGGPVAVGIAEWLAAAGRTVAIVTGDQVAGSGLSMTGDLSDANGRLQRAGVRRHLRSGIAELSGGRLTLRDVWTGACRQIDCAVLIDAGPRLPDDDLYLRRPGTARAGDCVAPRTAYQAVLEGRRRALECIGAGEPTGRPTD